MNKFGALKATHAIWCRVGSRRSAIVLGWRPRSHASGASGLFDVVPRGPGSTTVGRFHSGGSLTRRNDTVARLRLRGVRGSLHGLGAHAVACIYDSSTRRTTAPQTCKRSRWRRLLRGRCFPLGGPYDRALAQ